MSRALTALGVALLWSTAGCIHPHSWHLSHHRGHGNIHVSSRHHLPRPVIHTHGHGCGHVRVGLEWVISSPGTRHGSVTPPPTSAPHDRGLHRRQDVSPQGREHSELAEVHEVASVLQETPQKPGHQPGPGKGRDRAQEKGHKSHGQSHGQGHDKDRR